MLSIQDNCFNAGQERHQSKLKLWRYAGLMLTYRCNAACRFCYYYCRPQAGGLMSPDLAVKVWAGLERISGTAAKVHLTGGEPFLYPDRLIEICKKAKEAGLKPADFVETNAGLYQDETEIVNQLKALDACGLKRLKISWDVFHEEFVDIDVVRRYIDIARDIMGAQRVLVRWEKDLQLPSGIKTLAEAQKQDVFRQAVTSDHCRFTGRAAEALGDLVEGYPIEHFCGCHCQNALLGSKGVHIDPYGNVFNGQCSGMAVGNVNDLELDDIWRAFNPAADDFWSTLYHEGPYGFVPNAKRAGYQPLARYASKCHLCSHIRRFFFDTGQYPSIITPSDCYDSYT